MVILRTDNTWVLTEALTWTGRAEKSMPRAQLRGGEFTHHLERVGAWEVLQNYILFKYSHTLFTT